MWWIILSSVVVNFTDCKKNGRKSLKIFALQLIDRKWKNDNLLDICNLFFETEEISPKKNKYSKDFSVFREFKNFHGSKNIIRERKGLVLKCMA